MKQHKFSILKNTEENTNLAIHELIQISLEEGILTQRELDEIDREHQNKLKEHVI